MEGPFLTGICEMESRHVPPPHFLEPRFRYRCRDLLRRCENASPDIRGIAERVSAIPGLSSRILAAANTSIAGSPIDSVDHAVVFLGAVRVREIVTSLLVPNQATHAEFARPEPLARRRSA